MRSVGHPAREKFRIGDRVTMVLAQAKRSGIDMRETTGIVTGFARRSSSPWCVYVRRKNRLIAQLYWSGFWRVKI